MRHDRNQDPTDTVHVIGGGLAGSEAAWQIANAGVPCSCTRCAHSG